MSVIPPQSQPTTSGPSAPPATSGGVTRRSAPMDSAKLWKTARDFEAMALGEFLKPMFATVEDGKGIFGPGEGEKTWKPMLVDEIGKQIAAAGGLGLAGPIHDAMLKMQEGKS